MATDDSSRGWNLDPVKLFDLAMNIINKLGLPLVLLVVIGYYVVPAHLEFLRVATESQKSQTHVVENLGDAADKVFKVLSSTDLKKIEKLDSIDNKLTEHSETFNRVETKVDGIKACVEKQSAAK